MTLVRNPPGKPFCGQACVASIAGISLKEACELIHEKERGTYTYEVRNALQSLGFHTAERCRPIRRNVPNIPPYALVALKKGTLLHWAFQWEGKLYDPSGFDHADGWRATSYLEVFV